VVSVQKRVSRCKWARWEYVYNIMVIDGEVNKSRDAEITAHARNATLAADVCDDRRRTATATDSLRVTSVNVGSACYI